VRICSLRGAFVRVCGSVRRLERADEPLELAWAHVALCDADVRVGRLEGDETVAEEVALLQSQFQELTRKGASVARHVVFKRCRD
jgi:hypothetical protein